MTDYRNILLKPIITEKSTNFKMDSGYVFSVIPSATKIDIRRAVEHLFKVKVESVNTSHVRGKTKAVGRKIGHMSSWKKAYVKLKDGQKIDMIEGML